MEEVIKLLYLFKRYKNSDSRSFFFGQTQNYLLDNFQANFQTLKFLHIFSGRPRRGRRGGKLHFILNG